MQNVSRSTLPTLDSRFLQALLALALAAIFPVQAMMTPEEYRAARNKASHWIQLRVESVQRPARLPGVCLITAEVTRVFRGPPLREKRIDLAIDCKKRDQRSPPGDEFRMNFEDLARGRYAEAFVELRDGQFTVVARQIGRIGRPGPKPAFKGKE